MPSLSEDKMAILFVAAVFIWTLVALPIMYLVEHWTADDIIALFTAVLAVSTIGLWLVTGQGIRAQARDTQILQRAYVAVEPLGIHSLKNSVEAVAHINIKNVGHLPARVMSNGQFEVRSATITCSVIFRLIMMRPRAKTLCPPEQPCGKAVAASTSTPKL
jgi:hypothetical protein